MKRRQKPKGKKVPRGYGQQPASVDEITKRLRQSPPRPRRLRTPRFPPRA